MSVRSRNAEKEFEREGSICRSEKEDTVEEGRAQVHHSGEREGHEGLTELDLVNRDPNELNQHIAVSYYLQPILLKLNPEESLFTYNELGQNKVLIKDVLSCLLV